MTQYLSGNRRKHLQCISWSKTYCDNKNQRQPKQRKGRKGSKRRSSSWCNLLNSFHSQNSRLVNQQKNFNSLYTKSQRTNHEYSASVYKLVEHYSINHWQSYANGWKENFPWPYQLKPMNHFMKFNTNPSFVCLFISTCSYSV